jgi:uncharacterized protein involved in response to NO
MARAAKAGERKGGAHLLLLVASIYAVLLAGLWMPVFLGFYALPTAFPPAVWHQHEWLFGLAPAFLASIVLGAMAQSGTRPVPGGVLALLLALWLAGRIAFAYSAHVGMATAIAIDLSFPLLALALLGRRLLAGRDRRLFALAAAVLALLAAHILSDWEIWRFGRAVDGQRLALAVLLVLFVIRGRAIDPHVFRRRGDGGARPLAAMAEAAYLFVALGFLFAGLAVFFPLAGFDDAALRTWLSGSITLALLAGTLRFGVNRDAPSGSYARLVWIIGALALISASADIALALAPQFTLVLLPLSGLARIGAFSGAALALLSIRPFRACPPGR